MFPISFVSYYSSFIFFFNKYKLYETNLWLYDLKKNFFFFKNISDILSSFCFFNFTIITFFNCFFFIYYKYKIENHQSLNKTPFIYFLINCFLANLTYQILFYENYYDIFIMNVYFFENKEYYFYFPFFQIFMYVFFFFNSKHLCYQIGSVINQKKMNKVYQKHKNFFEYLYICFWYYLDFIFLLWFISFFLNSFFFFFSN